MGIEKKFSKYALIAGIFFVASTACQICIYIDWFTEPPNSIVSLSVYIIGFVLFSISLLTKKKTFALYSAAIITLGYILMVLFNGITGPLMDIPSVLFYISLIILFIFSIKRNTILHNFWVVPGILASIQFIIRIFAYQIFVYGLPVGSFLGVGGFVWLVNDIIIIIAAFFIGLWLKGDLPEKRFQRTEGKIDVPKAEIGGAEKIKALKELLDSGIISQEEFDNKKKEILDSSYM